MYINKLKVERIFGNNMLLSAPLVQVMASQEEVAIVAACIVIIGAGRQKNRKRMWVRPYLQSRGKQSGNYIKSDLKKDYSSYGASFIRGTVY
uniref:Uncharacterized protein n=1 Tax=Timema poppense TaxID=170557 RepID=A0A7R9DCK9_TIMPO|nr:unnamed protein product [Timema poppensis]